jgi:hypothetical protein
VKPKGLHPFGIRDLSSGIDCFTASQRGSAPEAASGVGRVGSAAGRTTARRCRSAVGCGPGPAAGPDGRPGRGGRRVRPRLTADSSGSRPGRVRARDGPPSDHGIGRSAGEGRLRLRSGTLGGGGSGRRSGLTSATAPAGGFSRIPSRRPSGLPPRSIVNNGHVGRHLTKRPSYDDDEPREAGRAGAGRGNGEERAMAGDRRQVSRRARPAETTPRPVRKNDRPATAGRNRRRSGFPARRGSGRDGPDRTESGWKARPTRIGSEVG